MTIDDATRITMAEALEDFTREWLKLRPAVRAAMAASYARQLMDVARDSGYAATDYHRLKLYRRAGISGEIQAGEKAFAEMLRALALIADDEIAEDEKRSKL